VITQQELFGKWPNVDDKTQRAVRDRLIEAGTLELVRNPDAHNRIEFSEEQASVLIEAIENHIGRRSDKPDVDVTREPEEGADVGTRDKPAADTEEEEPDAVAKGAGKRRTDSPDDQPPGTRQALFDGASTLRGLFRQPGIEADREISRKQKPAQGREKARMSVFQSEWLWILLLLVTLGVVLWLVFRPKRITVTTARDLPDSRRRDLRQRAGYDGISLDNPPDSVMRDIDRMIEDLP